MSTRATHRSTRRRGWKRSQRRRELLDRDIDLCVVATPTITHEEIALEMAEAHVPTLIEKPLAHKAKAAQAISEAFDRNGVIGCVGHIERYNPALQDLRRRLADGELGNLYQVITRRQGPFPARITDAGVILDPATHDIDLTAWVTGSTYQFVSARIAHGTGRRVHEDLVSCVGELSGGIVVTHLVNWLSPLKERVTTVTGEFGCFVADTLTADLTFYKNGTEFSQWDRMAAFRGVTEGDITRYAIAKPEPLLTELSASWRLFGVSPLAWSPCVRGSPPFGSPRRSESPQPLVKPLR